MTAIRYGTEFTRRLVERAILDDVLLDPRDVQLALNPSLDYAKANEMLAELHADDRLDTPAQARLKSYRRTR